MRLTGDSQESGREDGFLDALARMATPRRRSLRWRTLLQVSDQGLDVFRRKRSGVVMMGTLTADDVVSADGHKLARQLTRLPSPIVLRLRPDDVLARDLALPAGTEDVLDAIVENQLTVIAPWAEGQALYDYQTTRPDRGQETKINVHVIVTGREIVARWQRLAKRWGLSPQRVDVGTPADATSTIDFTATEPPQRATARQLFKWGLLTAAALSLGAGALAGVGALEGIDELRKQRDRLTELNDRARKLSAGLSRKSADDEMRKAAWTEKLSEPSSAVLLEVLSRALPDGIWLRELEFQQDTIRLVGTANVGQASGLVAHLEALPHLSGVRLAAPIARSESPGHERFVIEAMAERGLKHRRALAQVAKPEKSGSLRPAGQR